MRCGYCGKPYGRPVKVCPHCGQDPGSGVFQTSTILIATEKGKSVYGSVAEVPPGLRTKLTKYTTGTNAGMVIIADRRGRQEIARALQRDEIPSAPAKAVDRLRRWAPVALLVFVALAAAVAALRWLAH